MSHQSQQGSSPTDSKPNSTLNTRKKKNLNFKIVQQVKIPKVEDTTSEPDCIQRPSEHFDSFIPVPFASDNLNIDWRLSSKLNVGVDQDNLSPNRSADPPNTNSNNSPAIMNFITLNQSNAQNKKQEVKVQSQGLCAHCLLF